MECDIDGSAFIDDVMHGSIDMFNDGARRLQASNESYEGITVLYK
jgi:hypothetical protein